MALLPVAVQVAIYAAFDNPGETALDYAVSRPRATDGRDAVVGYLGALLRAHEEKMRIAERMREENVREERRRARELAGEAYPVMGTTN